MSPKDTASTFVKGLRVLDCFEGGRDDLSMAEIARLTGFDRATVRRLCLTLESSGYLYRQGKALRLTPRVLALSGGYLSSERIGKVVQPVLNHCAESLQGEVALAVRDGARAIYVARSAVASARLSHGFSVGSTLPLLPTAVGRMLLAGCESATRADIIAACPLSAYTPLTALDPVAITASIEDAQRDGFAYVAEEFERGAAGVAVPVQDLSGTQAVLASTASVNQMTQPGRLDAVLDLLRQAALSLSG